MRNDAELLRAANAQWAVVPMTDEVRKHHRWCTACSSVLSNVKSSRYVGMRCAQLNTTSPKQIAPGR